VNANLPLRPRPFWPRPQDALARWAVIAGLVLVSLVMLSARPIARELPGRWYGLNEGRPIQGDVLYRGGLALTAAQQLRSRAQGVDPEGFRQAGMEMYERLALRREAPNVQAMYRLAVIYSREDNPDEGLPLLAQLVVRDEEHAELYLAVSAVYDPKPVPPAKLRQAAGIIGRDPDWIGRLVLADCCRRLGDRVQAGRVEMDAARRDYRFGTVVGLVALVYGLLLLVGVVMVVRYVLVRVWSTRAPAPWRSWVVPWGVLDSLEVAAALLAAMVFMGVLSEWAVRRVSTLAAGQELAALVVFAAYLAFCWLALLVMRGRLHTGWGGLFRVAGLAGPPRLKHLLQAMSGYGALIALVVGFAFTVRSAGIEYTFPPATPAVQVLQQLHSAPATLVYLVLICFVAPVVEEVIFRGFIYVGLRQRFRPPLAVILSALVFGVTHVRLAVPGMMAITCVGVLLALLYERSGSLWPSVIAHSVHNVLAFVVVLSLNV
jgi:membrane protease YdiL (CAAX protease family)